MSDDLVTPVDRNRARLSDPRAGGRQSIVRMHLQPPRPIVVSPSRLTLGGLGTALGVPLVMALLVAHFGDLHHLHMGWLLGGMALLMLLSISFSTSLTFEHGEVHLRTRLLGVLVRDRPLMSERVLERIVVRAIPSLQLGARDSSQYQLLLVGDGDPQVVGPFASKRQASEARLAILSGLAASRMSS